MYKKGTRSKVRFNTSVGYLCIEDMWDLSLTQLNTIAKVLNKELKSSEEEDFLEDESKEDIELKLKFDIVLDILNIKKEERKKREEASKIKAKKEKLLNILEKKQDEGLENMSEEDIKKELAELNR